MADTTAWRKRKSKMAKYFTGPKSEFTFHGTNVHSYNLHLIFQGENE